MSKKLRQAQRAELRESQRRLETVRNYFESSREPFFFWGVSVFLAVALALITHWPLFEADVFLHVRAGSDILSHGDIHSIDTWSHTAFGKPSFNFEWMSNAFVYGVYKIFGGYEALVNLRSFLVFLLFVGCAALIRRHSSRFSSWPAVLLLLPWVYIISYFRFQMRPDLFAINFFVLLLLIWTSQATLKQKRNRGLVTLFFWANFHSGTAPFGIFLWAMLNLTAETEETWAKKFTWALSGVGLWFVTPQGFNILHVMRDAVFKYDYSQTLNPDHQPLSLKLFELSGGGWSFILWLPYCILAAIGLLSLSLLTKETSEANAESPYFKKIFLLAIAGAFTFAVFGKIRSIHYQVIVLLPVCALFIQNFFSTDSFKKTVWGVGALSLGIGMFALWILPDHVRFVGRETGYGVSKTQMPVGTVEFIKRHRPKGEILNAYDFGGYLIAEAPEYKVSLDSRELQYMDFRKEMAAAQTSPGSTSAFLDKYKINVVLQKVPRSIYRGDQFVEVYEFNLNPQEWALVSMDNASVLSLRRIPEHTDLVAQYEYRHLRRGLPSSFGVTFAEGTLEQKQQREAEVDRCLKEFSENIFCILAKSSYEYKRGNQGSALALVESAFRVDSRNPEVILEFSEYMRQQNRLDRVQELDYRFGRLTTPL
jgi:hypothetical protein